MPTHSEERLLPFTPQQLFDMVADVESYPKFLPWCEAVRIKRREEKLLVADLVVGFKLIREAFTSHVDLDRHNLRIGVEYLDGPFRYLKNYWIFKEHEGGCLIDFHVDFEFRSKLLKTIMEPIFHEAVRLMVGAFEQRAHSLYFALE